jgi:dCMP deaminase
MIGRLKLKSQSDWDLFYMRVADLISQQSYAEDRKVGAIIVKDDNIIAFSYNGTPRGTDNDTQAHEVLHAEAQAIAKVSRSNQTTLGATLYSTLAPCIDCSKLIFAVGIHRVVYRDPYKCSRGLEFLTKHSIIINNTQIHEAFIDPMLLINTGLYNNE